DFYLQYLREQLLRVTTSEQMLTELYNTEAEEARKLRVFTKKDDDFQADKKSLHEMREALVKRLENAGVVKAVGGYDASTISPPGLGKKVAPSGLLVFPLAALLGLLFGCGLVSLAERTDKSFRTPDEIRRRLGLPVVGYIPQLHPADAATTADAGLSPMLCSHYRSRSREAEAYRGVRTALYFSTHGEGHK